MLPNLKQIEKNTTIEKLPQFSDALSLIKSLNPERSVYCIRPSVLESETRRFIELFPGKVMYSVKCNPHPLILDSLYKAGIRKFDVASEAEIVQIGRLYPEAQMHFMHPVKSRSAIRKAYWTYGIRHFAVDHCSELNKILEETGGKNLTIMVRIKTPPSDGCLIHLSKKFGADPVVTVELIEQVKHAGCKVGITFHVGSQCIVPGDYGKSLDLVGQAMKAAGINPVCIDIGGGFPADYSGHEVPPLEEYIVHIKEGLERINPDPKVEIFAEPGRALVANGCSLLTRVILRKEKKIFINDGIFGALSELKILEKPLAIKRISTNKLLNCDQKYFSVFGVTCDSEDMLPHPIYLPENIKEGDWLEIDQIGAYSNALSTDFNGFRSDSFAILNNSPPHFSAAR